MPMTRDEHGVTITLTYDEYVFLALALGYAAGAAKGKDEPKFFSELVRLANTVHKGDPNWTPYEVPAPEATP